MTNQEAIKWIENRMCSGRYTPTEHNPLQIDECWQAGRMATKALSVDWDAIIGEINDQIKRETIDGVESDVAVGLYHALGIIEKHLREAGL